MNDIYWKQFVLHESLNQNMEKQFLQYMELLITFNAHTNLTTIIEPQDIVAYHFQDSLSVGHAVDMTGIQMIADIGTGAGFPGIPLKIKYPMLNVLLLEVNEKKITFLHQVIEALGLEHIQVCAVDWRTFIRTTDYPINMFTVRASLALSEIFRIYTPLHQYRDATVVYWASEQWRAQEQERKLLKREYMYTVGERQRKLIFFSL